jgi:hypothetical protein
MLRQNRRDFLKTSAAGAAGLMATGAGVKTVFGKTSAGGWTTGMAINPGISNLRVAWIKDNKMLNNGEQTGYGDLGSANGKADAALVKTNLDKCAMALANTEKADDAWKKIFQKPTTKEWKDVTAAIKVNMLGSYQPVRPVLKAICDGLKAAGVEFKNITVYDATKDGCIGAYGGFYGDVKTSNGSGSWKCNVNEDATNVIKDVDILISCVANKCHQGWGKYTLNLKNHIGSVRYHCPDNDEHLAKINQSDAIIGNPGPGKPPKQQLCVVDSLFGSINGDWGGGTDLPSPCVLIMGTLAPSVDLACVQKVKKDIMKGNPDVNRMTSLFKNFGYADADATTVLKDTGSSEATIGGWVDAKAYVPTVATKQPTLESSPTGRTVDFSVNAPGYLPTSTKLVINHSSNMSLSVTNLQGRLVRSLELPANMSNSVIWDGRDNTGRLVRSGRYIATIRSGNSVVTSKFTMSK